MIPAREWNKLRAWVARATPLAGTACLLTRTGNGVTLRPDRQAFTWRHPWHVTCAWNEKEKKWFAQVRPGFVNGIEPTINEAGTPRPLTASPAPWLHLPAVALSTAPPKFFAALGVRDPTEGFRIGGGSGVQIVDESWRDAFRPPPRKLASCDISLSIARASLGGGFTVQDAGAAGQNVDYTPTLLSTLLSSRGSRPVVQASPKFTPPRAPTRAERLLGTATDPQEDAMLLATVFLLSPPNHDGPIDGSWTPYVRHELRWNLAHAPRRAATGNATPIRIATGLAGGMFDGLFNQLLAPGNEQADRLMSALASQSPEGRFWTI